MLRELGDVIARPPSTIFAQLRWLGEVPDDWRKENITLIFKTGKKEEPGNYKLVSLALIPGRRDFKLVNSHSYTVKIKTLNSCLYICGSVNKDQRNSPWSG
ncbi:rna-directed dna polymerase from mobile element hypothetical protein [Limosa lapponica baueri]|uniref:Uncharacterized protein n=1 Tax=Limosa lapponica baueri TaxID=1758121 RepID=A0A2I0TP92_LIMLA|nr:rna-directed dna polymerase from mobile element hypothetical protein [Limosa lapponica baueri]